MSEKDNFRQKKEGTDSPNAANAPSVASKSVIKTQNDQSVCIDVNGKFPGAVAIDIHADARGVAVGVQGKGQHPMPTPMIPMPAPIVAAQPAAEQTATPASNAAVGTMPATQPKQTKAEGGNAGTPQKGAKQKSAVPMPLLPTGADIRLPVRGKVVDRRGGKIAKIRSCAVYDKKGRFRGEFEKCGTNVFLVKDDCRTAYVDKNDNIFTAANDYVGTIRRFRWAVVFVVLLILLLTTAASVALGAYYIAASGWYAPTLFVATEDGDSWKDTKNLPVFVNEPFGDTVMVPGMSGTYRFIFENRNEDALEYSLSFAEENAYGIEMVYRLKRDGLYISGGEEWHAADELGKDGLTIEAKSSTVFELQWRWNDKDENDTAAGENEAIYRLHISLSAQVGRLS